VIATVCRWGSTAGAAMALVTVVLVTSLTSSPTGATARGTALNLAAAPAPAPGAITIGTVPKVEGFPVTLDGVTRWTNSAGNVSFDSTASGRPLIERIPLNDAVVTLDGQRVQAKANRVYRSGNQHLLALDISYLVTFKFTGPSGAPIDPAGLGEITVKSPTGQVSRLPADQPAWLQGSRVVSTGTGPAADELEWTVQQVKYSGANVVNTSQQRFRPAGQKTIDVKLLFFSLTLQVRDAFFRHPEGSAVDLVYPDGHSQRYGIGAGGRVSIPTLPRGHYSVAVVGPGPHRLQPLAISRDQDLQLSFYTWWDLATVVFVLGALMAALAVVGARRRVGTVKRRHSDVSRTRRGGGNAPESRRPAAGRTQRPVAEGSGTDLAVASDRRTE
jgi:hypothetical protein